MKRLFIILSALSLIATGCQKDPYADASINPSPAYVGEEILFTNLSTNTDYVEWDMGDGSTSTAYNVTHTYYDPGIYNVTQRAFNSGRASTATYMVEVIGAELNIVVQEYYDIGAPPGALIPGASVMLYPSYDDWFNFTNPVVQYINGVEVIELFTNTVGEVIFENLSYQRYYVDVWHQNYTNEILAGEDIGWIETDPYYSGFIAFVDYVENAKKSTSRPEGQMRQLEEGTSTPKRELKINKISKTRK